MRIAGVALVFVVTTGGLGCHFDRGELYEPRGGGAGDTAATEIPLLPALPDEGVRDACEACAAEKCSEARANCLEDDACTAQLECKGICDDPACLADCEAERGLSGWFDDLWRCTFLDCASECNVGRNWGCVERYDWSTPDSPLFDLTVRFREPATALFQGTADPQNSLLIGAEVRACPPNEPVCLNPDDSGVVDVTNGVTLRVQRFGTEVSYLEVESDEHGGFPVRELLSLPLASRDAELDVPVVPRRMLSSLLFGGWTLFPDDSSSGVLAWLGDCLQSPAGGVRMEVPSEPEAEVWHLSSSVLTPGLEETNAGIAFAPAIAGEAVRLRIVRTDTGERVAERTIVVRPGWLSQVFLGPLSR